MENNLMADINTTVQTGRLTRDPEFKTTPNGTAILKFGLANNGYKENDVNYFECTAWGKLAESMSKWLTKGKQVGITGRLKYEQWEKDGQKRNRISIVAEQITLLGGKPEASAQPAPQEQAGAPQAGPSNDDILF
jgi:single-strand DNA-binding protein